VTLQYLLDTNTISEPARPFPNRRRQWSGTPRLAWIRFGSKGAEACSLARKRQESGPNRTPMSPEGAKAICYHCAMSRPADSAGPREEAKPSSDPDAQQPHVWEGDDDHVIFWMLSLTPTQRLEVLQNFMDGVRMLRNGLRS